MRKKNGKRKNGKRKKKRKKSGEIEVFLLLPFFHF